MSVNDASFKKENYVVRVTLTKDFLFPNYFGDKKEIIDSFIRKHNLGQFHAARDGSALKGSEKVVDVQEIPWEDLLKEVEERTKNEGQ